MVALHARTERSTQRGDDGRGDGRRGGRCGRRARCERMHDEINGVDSLSREACFPYVDAALLQPRYGATPVC